MSPILPGANWRALLPGQVAQLSVADVETGEVRVVHESATLTIEAPNWSPDGQWLVFNAAGLLYRVPASGGEPEAIDTGHLVDNNNDHVISPDGRTIYSSAEIDGHLYAIPFEGGTPVRVSNEWDEPFGYFLQGVSPDGSTLSYTGAQRKYGRDFATNLFTISAVGGPDVRLTEWDQDSVGCEYSPDGEWLYFNSERGSATLGHAQIHRMRLDGTGLQRLTGDERVNWFPKLAPDGRVLVYLSFPPGTIGHGANVDVVIRRMNLDGSEARDLIQLFGGQGTLNVNSWAPDSRHFAFVQYPVSP